MANIRQETIQGVKWTLLPWLVLKPLSILYSMVLARLVSPGEIGVLEVTAIFFSIAGNLNNCGMGTALIRKQDRTEQECSTVFWYNMGMSGMLMLLFWCFAPFFAGYYGLPDLCPLTIVSSVLMFINASAAVHDSLFLARRDFKTLTLVGALASFVSMPLTLLTAYYGFSYWSLIIGQIGGSLTYLVLIWWKSPWKPRWVFSTSTFKEFFLFGVRLTIATIITNIYDGSRKLVIGKMYSMDKVGLFDRSFKLCSMPLSIADGIWKQIALPIISTIQDDDQRLVRVYRQYIRMVCMVILWGMMTLVANGNSVVHILYGEQWLPCVPYMQVLCFSIMFNPLTFINENVYLVKGRSDIVLKREIIFRVFGISAMALGACHSVMGICVASIASDLFCCLVSLHLTRRILPLKMSEQLTDMLTYAALAVLVNVPAYFINEHGYPPYIAAPIGCGISALLYYLILRTFKDPTLGMLVEAAKEKWRRSMQKLFNRAS